MVVDLLRVVQDIIEGSSISYIYARASDAKRLSVPK